MSTFARYTPPPLRANYIERPRLLKQMQAALQRSLTLVVGPPGSGKTTLVAEYAAYLQELDVPVAWVTLHRRDDDVPTFQGHLLAMLRGLLPYLNLPQPSERLARKPLEAFMLTYMDVLSIIDTRCVMVLDDYHVIANPAIHDAVALLIEQMPQAVHLVIGSRSDPPLPLARLRARDQLVEVRSAELRFAAPEARAFLTDTMGLHLREDDVTALEARTEGWIGGLQLAALSLRGRDDLDTAIGEVAGDNRFIQDFLLTEVLTQQSSEVQRFLLYTSVVDRLSGSLCDALLQSNGSQDILEQLEHDNLFLMSLDMRRHWYRYHQLFGDFLRARLERSEPAMLPTLLRRASDWYERQDMIEAAIEHALWAEDYERVTALLTAHLSWTESDSWPWQTWLEKLPTVVIRQSAFLSLLYAFDLTSRDVDAAEEYFNHSRTMPIDDTPEIQAGFGRVRAAILAEQGDLLGAIQVLEATLASIKDDPIISTMLWKEVADLRRLAHDYSGARAALQTGLSHIENEPDFRQWLLTEKALEEMKLGLNEAAVASCREAIEIGERGDQRLPLTGRAYLYLTHVLFEWNRLDEALQNIQSAITWLERGGKFFELFYYSEALLRLACIHFAQGDHTAAGAVMARARAQIDEAVSYARCCEPNQERSPYYWLPPWFDQVQAHLWLLEGNQTALEKWLADPASVVDYEQHMYLVLPRYHLLRREPAQALAILDDLQDHPEVVNNVQRQTSIQTLRALALQASGETNEAISLLRAQLDRASQAGYVRIFLDGGAPVLALLRRVIDHPYAVSLMTHFGEAAPPPQPLADPLTERDLDVLKLIAAGLTNREIAEKLVLTLGTVKWYTNSIYSKLGVRNRVQASERARQLGLI